MPLRFERSSTRAGALALSLLALAAPSTARAQWQQPDPGGQPPAPAPAPVPAPAAAPEPAPGAAPALGAAPAPAAPAPSPYDPSMQAGGLAPPPPMPQPAPGPGQPTGQPSPPSPTEQQLEEAKEEDSGRGFEIFYLNVEGGFQHVGLTTFSVNEQELTAGLIESSANGGMVGAGLGLRLFVLTLGARARAGFFSDWQLFSLGGELGVHIPLGRFDPHFDLGFGYTGLGSVTSAISGAADAVQISGFYGRLGGGLDIYITPAISIGANASFEMLGLTRPGVSPDQIANIQTNASAANAQQVRADLLQLDGTSYGSSLAITGVIGLHL